MAPLGLILVLPGGAGALAAGGFTVGIGVGAGWRGRAVDRAGSRVGLRREGLALAGSSALLAVVVAGAPLAGVVAAAFVMGVTGSAVGMGYRAALQAFVPRQSTDSAYTTDAVLTELSFFAAMVTVNAGIGFALAALLLRHSGTQGVLTASCLVFTVLTAALTVASLRSKPGRRWRHWAGRRTT